MKTEIVNIKGTVIPKTTNDQNTDDILPARFLIEITFKKMGDYVYRDERFKNGKENKNHPFNDPKYKDGTILLAGANYGCGSSREHAPQGLYRYGIKAIIAESFAEIFAGNCASLGVIGITIPKTEIEKLERKIKEDPNSEVNIDLEEKTIKYGDDKVSFDIPEGRRQSFINGTWDAMAVLQKNEEEVNKTSENLEYLKFRKN